MSEAKPVNLDLPPELAEKIEKRIKGTDFSSLSAYVTYILKQVLSNLEEAESEKPKKESSEIQKKKVEERMKRLETLGYLD